MRTSIKTLISLFACWCLALTPLCMADQVGYYVYSGGVSTPAGTAPLIKNSSGTGCQTATCNFTVVPNATGDTIIWLFTFSPGGFQLPTSSQGETVTCGTIHTFTSSNSTMVCSFVAANTSSHSITNHDTVNQSDDVAVYFDLLCQSTCNIGGASYADTAATSAAGTATSGSVTTTHQLNELIISGFTQNYLTTALISTMTAVAPFTIPGTAGCTGGAGCGQQTAFTFARGAMEYFTTSAIGTYSGSVTTPNLQATVGFTLEVY